MRNDRKKPPKVERPRKRRSPPAADGVPILAYARDLERLGVRATGLLRAEWAAEVEVRIHLVNKKLGEAARKGAWSLLCEHSPAPEDLPGLIRDLPCALQAPSVRRLLGLLRAAATGAEERLEVLPGSPVFYRAARAPQVPKRLGRYLDAREDETIARRLQLLASIADAFRDALVKPPSSREAEALFLAKSAPGRILQEIETEAAALRLGSGREKLRVAMLREAGENGDEAHLLDRHRKALRRAK